MPLREETPAHRRARGGALERGRLALLDLQDGTKRANVKPLKGYGGTSVMEICEDYDTDTYRVVVTVEYEEAIYVLHSFKKKSKKGSEAPRNDNATLEARLKQAAEQHREWLKKRKE